MSAEIVGISPHIVDQLRMVYPDVTTQPVELHDCDAGPVRLVVDARAASISQSQYQSIGHIESLIDTAAIGNLTEYVVVHAGVISRNGCGIVIPAASGAGKSTLVAAACLSGFTCLSDELAIIDTTGVAWSFRKSICLKHGGWKRVRPMLGESDDVVSTIRPDGRWVRFLLPPSIQAHGQPQSLTHIIVPQRRAGATASIRETSSAAALAELVRHSINLPRHGAAGFETLLRLADESECGELIYDDLDEAVRLLTQLVGS